MKDEQKTKAQLLSELQAVRQSEELYRQLFEGANDAIVTFTLEGTVTSVNRGLEVMLGWAREELLGQHYRKCVAPASVALGEERTRRFLAGGRPPSIFEAEMMRKDGSVVPVEVRTRPIRDTAGKPVGMQGIYRDITARKQQTEELRRSKEQLALIFNGVSDLISLIEVEPGPHFRYIAVNPPLLRTLGLPEEKVIRHRVEDILPPAEAAAVVENYKAAMRAGRPITYEQQRNLPTGQFLFESTLTPLLDDSGRCTHLLGTSHDITARKQSEEALRESEERFRNLFENANDAIAIVDMNRTVVSINRAMEQLLGWSREELIGQSDYKVLTPAGIALSEERERRIQNEERVPSIFEHEFVRKDGGKVLVEGRTRFIKDKVGKPTGFQGIYRDITARKQAEEEREELQEQLFQARKLEALGTLAGGVAHDFNNILSAIMGFTELAADDVTQGTEAHHNLQEVLKASRRAKALVQQILTFSQPLGRQKTESVPLPPIIEEVLTFLQASLPQTIEIQRHLDEAAGSVAIPPSQLRQVLTNLCHNAVRALGDKGGLLEVSLQQLEVGRDLIHLHSNLRPGPHLQLTVRDTGCGMSPEVQDRIFEPFFTTRPVGEGNGLGLAIVHGIVTGHGGALTVDSTVGKGTTFQVYLPVTEGSRRVAATSQAAAPEALTLVEEKREAGHDTHLSH